MSETTYTIRMNVNTAEANDWYVGYDGTGYTLSEACELAVDLDNSLMLIDAAGFVRYFVSASGNYMAA